MVVQGHRQMLLFVVDHILAAIAVVLVVVAAVAVVVVVADLHAASKVLLKGSGNENVAD